MLEEDGARSMKFAATVAMIDPAFYVPVARAAEAAGFDTIAVPDSIGYPQESSSTYPYNPDGTREFLENKPFLEPLSGSSSTPSS
jgi:alkanesulfonate monooxygenase SsuD/methylene tetrahydromethanopterin reductase-like flavin-dependent oxidoreductase (luciferase family)